MGFREDTLPARNAAALGVLLEQDPLRRQALQAVAALRLPDCWIGAGFVRDLVWDVHHGLAPRPPAGDVDVIWFDHARSDARTDRGIEDELRARMPALAWSVKNQARMHRRNNDPPYASACDAMRHWPETATAVAARLAPDGTVEIAAPLGLDDLFALRLAPTPPAAPHTLSIIRRRLAAKRWLERYPRLQLCDELTDRG